MASNTQQQPTITPRPEIVVVAGMLEGRVFLDLDALTEHLPGAFGTNASGRWIDLEILGGGYDEHGLYLDRLPYVLQVPTGLAADWNAMAGAALAGGGGSFYHRLYKSDRNGTLGKQIPTTSAAVSLDNERIATWEAQIETRALNSLDKIGDWVRIIAYYDHEGTTYEFPLGLYYFRFPKDSASPESTDWKLSGYSPEALLSEKAASEGLVFQTGTPILGTVATILSDEFGFEPERILFPPFEQEVYLAAPYVADPLEDFDSCFWINIVNGLLNAGGFRSLYTDSEGYLLTGKVLLTDTTPAAAYDSEDFRLRFIEGTIEGETDTQGFANRVIVKSTNSLDVEPIIQMATNTDPDSPTSILPSGLGYVVQGQPHEFENLVSKDEARQLAQALLYDAIARHRSLAFTSIPDYRRGPHELIDLNMRGSNGRVVATGYHLVRRYDITLPASDGATRPQMSWTVDKHERPKAQIAGT